MQMRRAQADWPRIVYCVTLLCKLFFRLINMSRECTNAEICICRVKLFLRTLERNDLEKSNVNSVESLRLNFEICFHKASTSTVKSLYICRRC